MPVAGETGWLGTPWEGVGGGGRLGGSVSTAVDGFCFTSSIGEREVSMEWYSVVGIVAWIGLMCRQPNGEETLTGSNRLDDTTDLFSR